MPSTQKDRPPSKTRYEYKPPKAEMRATQPNPVLEGISSGLGSFRNFLDALGNAKRPLPQKIPGIGHGLIGTAPEEIHEWASGFSPFSEEPNLGNRLDPRIKPGREQGLIDVAMTGADIGGLGLAGLRRGARAAYPTLNPEVNMSRREFMGNTGKAAAGLAAASVVPDVLRVADNATPHIAPSAARHAAAAATRATSHEYFSAIKSADRISRAHYDAILAREYDRGIAEAVKEGRIKREQGVDTPYNENSDVLEDIHNEARNEALNRSLEVRERLVKQIKEDPKYAKYSSLEDKLDAVHRDSMDNGDFDVFDNAVTEWKRDHGILNEPEIKAKLKSGETYIDPQTGHEAVLTKHGEVEYRDVETGEQRRYSHWIPEKKGAPKHFPEEHGIFDEEVPTTYDIYAKHMQHTPAEKMQISKKAAHENTRRAFQDAQKFDYLDDFTVEEMKQLRDELSGEEFKRGGSVTMPNNYRMGGRVRMI